MKVPQAQEPQPSATYQHHACKSDLGALASPRTMVWVGMEGFWEWHGYPSTGWSILFIQSCAANSWHPFPFSVRNVRRKEQKSIRNGGQTLLWTILRCSRWRVSATYCNRAAGRRCSPGTAPRPHWEHHKWSCATAHGSRWLSPRSDLAPHHPTCLQPTAYRNRDNKQLLDSSYSQSPSQPTLNLAGTYVSWFKQLHQ